MHPPAGAGCRCQSTRPFCLARPSGCGISRHCVALLATTKSLLANLLLNICSRAVYARAAGAAQGMGAAGKQGRSTGKQDASRCAVQRYVLGTCCVASWTECGVCTCNISFSADRMETVRLIVDLPTWFQLKLEPRAQQAVYMYTRLLVPPTDGKCKTGLAASHFTAVHVCTVCTTPLPGPFQTYRCKPGLAQTWRHPSKHTGVLLHLYAAHSSANTPCGMSSTLHPSARPSAAGMIHQHSAGPPAGASCCAAESGDLHSSLWRRSSCITIQQLAPCFQA